MADWDVVNQAPMAPSGQGGGWDVVSTAPAKYQYAPLPTDPASGAADGLAAQAPGPDFDAARGTFVRDLKDQAAGLWKTVKRVGHDVANPGDAVEDVKTIGKGLYAAGKQVVQDPIGMAKAIPGAVEDQMVNHPAGTLLNLLTLGSGGGLTAGRGLLKGTTLGLKAADEVAGIPAAMVSGVGRRSQRAAFAAGEKGGAEGSAFTEGMTGASDGRAVADSALNAADKLAADKNIARNADAAQWNVPGGMADASGVHQALADAHLENQTSLGAPRNVQAKAALDRIGEVLDQHTTIPSHNGFGPTKVKALSIDDMDALKQAVGEVMFDKNMAPQGTPASVLSRKVYDAAKDAASKVSPKYAGAMESNQENIRNLQSLRQEFGLKRNASSGAILSKLQSAMRNDVSSKFGYRGKLLDQLATKDSSLPYALAGQDFSSWMPRGLAKVGEGTAIGGAALTGHAAALLHPAAIATVAASIPRVQGVARYAAGSTVRGARAVGATQANLGKVAEILRLLSQKNDAQ